MVLLSVLVLLDALQHGSVRNTHRLHQRRQILQVEVSVRAAVRLPRPRGVLCQNLLAAKGAVAASSPVRVAAHVAVRVTHIVSVVLVELVVGDFVERAAPEHEALLEIQADAFKEQRVLQASKVLEVSVSPEGAVQVGHARREVLGEIVDVGGGDLGASRGRRVGCVRRVGGDEILGEVVEDGCQTVVFIETRQSARSHL